MKVLEFLLLLLINNTEGVRRFRKLLTDEEKELIVLTSFGVDNEMENNGELKPSSTVSELYDLVMREYESENKGKKKRNIQLCFPDVDLSEKRDTTTIAEAGIEDVPIAVIDEDDEGFIVEIIIDSWDESGYESDPGTYKIMDVKYDADPDSVWNDETDELDNLNEVRKEIQVRLCEFAALKGKYLGYRKDADQYIAYDVDLKERLKAIMQCNSGEYFLNWDCNEMRGDVYTWKVRIKVDVGAVQVIEKPVRYY